MFFLVFRLVSFSQLLSEVQSQLLVFGDELEHLTVFLSDQVLDLTFLLEEQLVFYLEILRPPQPQPSLIEFLSDR